MKASRSLFPVILLFCFSVVSGQSSPESSFISPLDIPLVLSGNYGEIRSGHFHAGIDIKTAQVEGKHVYAAMDGYIARISVQSGGYGNALYIEHPGGHMTVYGHLREFMPEVENYVRENQYRQKSFEVNLFPEQGKFTVKQGDLIAYSGSTGASGGPHLHFEIRESSTSIPLNVLNFGLPVTDNVSPRILWLAAYPLDGDAVIDGQNKKKIYPVVMRDGHYTIEKEKISAYGQIGFGIETYDYLNGSANRCSPYSMALSMDGRQYFRCILDSIPFDLGNYVSSHIDYEENLRSGKTIQKLFTDPNNRLQIYSNSPGGLINIPFDTAVHEVSINVTDSYKNNSLLKFSVVSCSPGNPVDYAPDPSVVERLYYNTANTFENDRIKVIVPQNALFNNLDLRYSVSPSPEGCLSDTFRIQDEYTPLYKAITVSIRTKEIPGIPADKIYVALMSGKGSVTSCGGVYKNGFVTASTGSFGRFFLRVDTVCPVIKPVSFRNEGKYATGQSISFRINDIETGISKYSGYIDGQWALFKYDPRTGIISYQMDQTRLKGSVMHDLEITVTDGMNNTARFVSRFFF